MIRVVTKRSDREVLKDWILPPPFITNAELRRPNTESALFRDWPGAVAGSGRLTPAEEVLVFKQFHYSGYRLRKIYRAANRRPHPSYKKDYGLWAQRHNQIRARLIDGNIGLVYDLVGRSRFANVDRDEMSSEGMMALLRAVDTFDPWRGFRFSTYACNAILRAFSRAALQDAKRRGLMVATWDPEFERSTAPENRRDDQRALFMERLQRVLRQDDAELTDIEKVVLSRRFPADDTPRRTLEDIGRHMRISKERVRQIQLSAIGKLRKALAGDLVLT